MELGFFAWTWDQFVETGKDNVNNTDGKW